ncbi:site-specific integrase [Brevibacillus gelatini]|uniref:Site-specific integrase n=1 Tax=Brevibacillus gelatini TaxID=1655277 RepID=A0A3M8B7H6_9BACL|nr:site-specific integrase [Brevibacillus gelatini]RNB59378.1 site-specific integrase [Brevibacillus gelatini]
MTTVNFFRTMNEKDLTTLENQFNNPQFTVIARLLFEGVRGYECSEITNLKVEDINFETKALKLHDSKGSERDLAVSDKCINLLKQAIEQKSFIYKSSRDNELREREFVNSEYVIRPIKTIKETTTPVSQYVLYARLQLLKEFCNENIKEFTREITKKFNNESGFVQRKLSKQELDQIDEKCSIPQLAVVVRLIHEGVTPQEIVNLKRQDVNFETNELLLTDVNGNQRKLEVSENCIQSIAKALEQIKQKEIPENDYVLKPSKALETLFTKTEDQCTLQEVVYKYNTVMEWYDHFKIGTDE